jgi:hypothetical protein
VPLHRMRFKADFANASEFMGSRPSVLSQCDPETMSAPSSLSLVSGHRAKVKPPPLQNLAGDGIDVNRLRLCGILNENFPYSAPAHLLQSGVERAASIGLLG